MDDESQVQRGVKWALGALGLGFVVAAISMPKIGLTLGLVILGIILVLALLLFGGYYLWRRTQNRRRSRAFSSILEAQASSVPRDLHDPNDRGRLDNLRKRFQEGLQEFKKCGKDIYKLPWYVIIGESGSGKTEAIRHSEIPFPRGLNKEMQGSGGTVNMDWWFTNSGIILDTAGELVFPKMRTGRNPEWEEFLRLLRKARPHCPVNGLFLVLSVESLIKDSAEKIAEKARLIGDQLDLIQRTLDVRFPVYLLVTKCDLLTGFREFFERIDDPMLQHQMFGWSNPDDLDAHFRPDLVEDHLRNISDGLRRRRLGLLLEAQSSGDTSFHYRGSTSFSTPSALDAVDALFALPESVMRLAPRLRRYLETIFVEGEWSAKPVFLRGIYFTSSMREGRTLDEAISFATGIPLDQLPEERRSWDRNRAFFLRDLFLEKVFSERGLVTRATNTLRLLRQRKFAIFGSAAAALLLLVIVSGLSYRSLRNDISKEAKLWKAGSKSWGLGDEWQPIVEAEGPSRYLYAGTNTVPESSETVVGYLNTLQRRVEQPLRLSLVFRPIDWIKRISNEDMAQRRRAAYATLTERSVIKPLLERTRSKMTNPAAVPQNSEEAGRLSRALLSLMDFQVDAYAIQTNKAVPLTSDQATNYLGNFISYLIESEHVVDTNLVEAVVAAYRAKAIREAKPWPPAYLLRADSLASNPAVQTGLNKFQEASVRAQTNVTGELAALNGAADSLIQLKTAENAWLHFTGDNGQICSELGQRVMGAKNLADNHLLALQESTRTNTSPLTNLTEFYTRLRSEAANSSASALLGPVQKIRRRIPESLGPSGLLTNVEIRLGELQGQAGEIVNADFKKRETNLVALDLNYVARTNGTSWFNWRWMLYTEACAIASINLAVEEADFGSKWAKYKKVSNMGETFRTNLEKYNGPYKEQVASISTRAAGEASRKVREDYVTNYLKHASQRLTALGSGALTFADITNAVPIFERVEADLSSASAALDEGAKRKVEETLPKVLSEAKRSLVQTYAVGATRELRSWARFPVVMTNSAPLNTSELFGLAKILDRLQGELTNSVWQLFPGSSDSLRVLRESALRGIVQTLVGESATRQIAQVEISWLPNAADKTILLELRHVHVSLGSTNKKAELTGRRGEVPVPLVEGPLDGLLRIDFSQFGEAPKPFVNEDDWGLIRLIQKREAVREPTGDWVVKVPVKNPVSATEGPVMFRFRIKERLPLPSLDEWPKQ